MPNIDEYKKFAGEERLRKFGQYFTPKPIAEYMVKWVGESAQGVILDPAVGNSVFANTEVAQTSDYSFEGYEIDGQIIEYFGIPENTTLNSRDFLTASWDEKYTAIVGNPPYNRFQLIGNRPEIYDSFLQNVGIKPNGLTNQYILFALKCLEQLEVGGRMALIIPTDFLESKTGGILRSRLVAERSLAGALDLNHLSQPVFGSTLTTSCILLVEKNQIDSPCFARLSDDDILKLRSLPDLGSPRTVDLDTLAASPKWTEFLVDDHVARTSTRSLGDFVKATRGIATGANDFFLLTQKEVDELELSASDYEPVITNSRYATDVNFTRDSFLKIAGSGAKCYLFNPRTVPSDPALSYIQTGESQGVHQKHLCSTRNPWYAAEKRLPAPIWIGQGHRGRIKVVRNLSGIRNLTTFHGIYPLPQYREWVDAIHALLVSDLGQERMKRAAKTMATGLLKFQPRDVTSAEFFDLDQAVGSLRPLTELGRELHNNPGGVDDIMGEINLITEKLA